MHTVGGNWDSAEGGIWIFRAPPEWQKIKKLGALFCGVRLLL